jgi:hypothetical protein
MSTSSPELLSLVWHRTKEAAAKNLGAVGAPAAVLAMGRGLDFHVVSLHPAVGEPEEDDLRS